MGLLLAWAAVLSLPPLVEAQAPAQGSDPLPVFTDVTSSSGIDYRNLCGAPPADKVYLNESMGAGAGWLDYDGDGKLDLFIVNGSAHDRKPGAGEPNRLYRGDGTGKFKDVTKSAGVGDRGWGYGVAVGDIENDGDPDLFITNLGPNALYVNRSDGTFENKSSGLGAAPDTWSSSAAFFDMDLDGDLDLYVANYVDFDKSKIPALGTEEAAKRTTCTVQGVPVFCGPLGLPPAQDVLYRNNGDGTFTDVTRKAGMHLAKPRYALGVVSGDYDNDGDTDIYVANDSVQNSLWKNNGDGTFSATGLGSLAGLDSAGKPQAGMGTDFGDYNGDGWLDLVVTNFSRDVNTLYRNMSGKFFVDESRMMGMGATMNALSWGTGFHDFDHDGDLDLFIANGHLYPNMDDYDNGLSFNQRNHLFLNQGGRFAEISARAGPGMAVERSFRGAAFGDYDDDGDVDILLTSLDRPVVLLRNDTPRKGHYLQVALVGTRSNRDAVGARVTISAGGRRQIRERKGGGSYLSQPDPRLHFGLGKSTSVELVQVRWPGGREQTLRDVQADRVVTVKETEPPKN